ncbi:MAG: hypothetical protein KY453_02640 [Gemmatimonadetes bacterium]|nr:hypothetical protein [Gemmatimonadota bacterium]
MTDIERKILDYMVQYLRSNTYQPSIREIGERFGIKSTKTVSEHLQALANKGHLERDPSRSRGVRILGVDLNPDAVSIPCYTQVPDERALGRGAEADAHITLDRRLVGANGGFFVRAQGEGLAVLGIEDGDLLLVEPAALDECEDGAVVLVRRGPAASFHRIGRNGRGVTLQALRPGEAATVVEEPGTLPLVGKVSALFRRMDGRTAAVSLTAH